MRSFFYEFFFLKLFYVAVTGELTVTVVIGSPFPPCSKSRINKQCIFVRFYGQGAKAANGLTFTGHSIVTGWGGLPSLH